MEVLEEEKGGGRGTSQLDRLGGTFPQGQGANLFISLEVTMKFY